MDSAVECGWGGSKKHVVVVCACVFLLEFDTRVSGMLCWMGGVSVMLCWMGGVSDMLCWRCVFQTCCQAVALLN